MFISWAIVQIMYGVILHLVCIYFRRCKWKKEKTLFRFSIRAFRGAWNRLTYVGSRDDFLPGMNFSRLESFFRLQTVFFSFFFSVTGLLKTVSLTNIFYVSRIKISIALTRVFHRGMMFHPCASYKEEIMPNIWTYVTTPLLALFQPLNFSSDKFNANE